MKEVILTVGPQGAGKTTFCEKIIQAHPEIKYISRDAILVEMYDVSPHMLGSDECELGLAKMYDELQRELEEPGDTRIIIDCWCATKKERKAIIERIKFFDEGTHTIGAWHFITPEEKYLEWWEVKYGPAWTMTVAMNTFAYRQYADKIEHSEGFNFIKEINLLKPPCFVHLFTPLVTDEEIPIRY